MKFLEIKSQKNPFFGKTLYQITHQKGWDFRSHHVFGKEVNESDSYVKYKLHPALEICRGEENLFLRGHQEEYDLNVFSGTIDLNKVTEFFKGPYSPFINKLDPQTKNPVSILFAEKKHFSDFPGEVYIHYKGILKNPNPNERIIRIISTLGTVVVNPSLGNFISLEIEKDSGIIEWITKRFSFEYPVIKSIVYKEEHLSQYESVHSWHLI